MYNLKLYTKKSGLPPGTLTFVGEQKLEKPLINLIQYQEQIEVEKEIEDIDELLKYMSDSTVTWIDICGVHDVSLVKKIGEQFSLHPLVQEDIMHRTSHTNLYINKISFRLRSCKDLCI
jgi:magnesium transporter